MEERYDLVWKDESIAGTFADTRRAVVPYGDAQLDLMNRLLASGPRAVARFADLGCGAGVAGQWLLKRWPGAQGIFADFSAPMLTRLRAALGEGTPHSVLEADLSDPTWANSLPPGELDAVVSAYAIHHLSHDRKQALYAEIHDLLAPGGWFVNVEHVAPATPLTTKLFEDDYVDRLVGLEDSRGTPRTRDVIARELVDRVDAQANILAPVEDQCAWLRDIGYVDVDCYFKVYELAVFGGRRPN